MSSYIDDNLIMSYYETITDYDLSKYDPHDTIMLCYDSGINRFVEASFGYVVQDIHRLLKPWQIMLFKTNNNDYVFPDITDSFLIELIKIPF